MKMSSDFLETSMPTTGNEEGSCCVIASLPCGCELLPVTGTFIRLFGLAMRGEQRSSSAATSTGASGRRRSVVRRRFAGFSLRFEARKAARSIEPESDIFGNIQGVELNQMRRGLGGVDGQLGNP